MILQLDSRRKENSIVHFFYKYGSVIFFIGLLLGVFQLIALETPFNAGVEKVLKWGALPWGIIVFGYTWRYQDQILRLSSHEFFTKKTKSIISSTKIWIYAICLYFLLELFSWPYFLGLNSIAVPNKEIQIKGVVVGKYQTKSRFSSDIVIIRDENLSNDTELCVSRDVYQQIEINSYFEKTMYMGRFGIPFRWKISWPAKINNWLQQRTLP